MNYFFEENQLLKNEDDEDANHHSNESSSTSPSSPVSSSSTSSSSSGGSSSSSELNPNDALQSPLTGLLKFEGFSMPTQIRNFNIPNIDMPNLPSLPNLRSFNMPSFQPSLPDLAQNLRMNLTNLQNYRPNMPNFPNFSSLTNVNTSAELQNLFNMFRISTNLPNLSQFPQLPQFPQFPQLPQLPQLPPFFSGQFSRKPLLKPWGQLKDSVKNMHTRLNDITQRVPENFHLRKWHTLDGSGTIRVYFLLNKAIYYCDSPILDSHRTKANKHNISSQPEKQPQDNQPSTSSVSNKQTSSHSASSSNSVNELLNNQPLQPVNLFELSFASLDSFEYDSRSSRLVFSIGTNIYYYDDKVYNQCDVRTPIKLESRCKHVKTDLQICPSDSNLIAYRCQGDIWCVDIATKQEFRLTNLRDLIATSSDIQSTESYHASMTSSNSTTRSDSVFDSLPFLLGRPSYILRDEFRRHHAFWWQPSTVCTKHTKTNGSGFQQEHRILYEETDQSDVNISTLTSCHGSIENQRFPRPGGANPVSKLKLVCFRLPSEDSNTSEISNFSLIDNMKELYPDYEYLLRAGWLGSDAVWCQMLNRRQNHLIIALISVSGAFEAQIIYEESNDMYWVSAHDILYFLNKSKLGKRPLVAGSELSFIWSSEESGYRHLYLISVRLGTGATSPRMVLKRQLSEGNWETDVKDLWVDEVNELIYFCGLRDSPLEKHLYVLSYSQNTHGKHHNPHGKTRIHRLTELNYTHSTLAFDEERTHFVNVQSNISIPPFGSVNRVIFHSKHRRLPDSARVALFFVNSFIYQTQESSHLDHLKSIGLRPTITYDCQADQLPGLGRPELFCCQLVGGELIYGSIFKPEFMESGVRYPTVLEIYGGPEIQLVSNNFMTLRQPTRHLLSSEGYIVVLIDCRGSGRRGLSFEAHSFQRLGQVELADQVEVLRWLAENTGYIDLNRVAIKGWSYGGYLALIGLVQYPDVFKIAIAGAPVTDWQMYDSAYTERFLGYPDENTDGYHKGSVINYVNLFPDQ